VVLNETCLNEDFSAMNSSITGMFLGTTDLIENAYNQAQVSSDCRVTDATRKMLIKIINFQNNWIQLKETRRPARYFYTIIVLEISHCRTQEGSLKNKNSFFTILMIKLGSEFGRLSFLNHRMQVGDINPIDVSLMDQQELRCQLAR
jgi:hypothetical protein